MSIHFALGPRLRREREEVSNSDGRPASRTYSGCRLCDDVIPRQNEHSGTFISRTARAEASSRPTNIPDAN